jgi:preprotein translocase subunit SecD
MSLLKEVRIIVLIALVLISFYVVIVPYIFQSKKIVVDYVANDAKCKNIVHGAVLEQVGGRVINSLQDFQNVLATVRAGDFVPIVSRTGPANCIAVSDSNLGFSVKELRSGNLKFGIDIEGGTRVVLQPKQPTTEKILQDTVSTLNTRINLYGLADIKISPLGENLIQIEVGGGSVEDIQNFLARQGKFEGKISYNIPLSDNAGTITLGDNQYSFKVAENKILLNGSEYEVGQNFVLENINYEVENVTADKVLLFANVFSGEDIVAVLTDPQFSTIRAVNNGYEFIFTVQISAQGAEKFAKLTKNQPAALIGSESYLQPKLVLFLDGEKVSELNIAASLAGQLVTSPSIQGFRPTREEALQEKLRLQTILRSGSLPVELQIVKVDQITQTAGKALINSTIIIMLSAAAAVTAVIFVRYRKIKIAVPMILISFSEILIILGFAALTQILTGGNGWVLDIAAIAGLVAIVGTGVNQLIIITDQLLLDREVSLKWRHRNAMKIIYNSAYTVIAAMIPLLVLGLGALRGFAITTIIGVLVAVAVTRPAYTSILERFEKLV